jgi:hypothetical protein
MSDDLDRKVQNAFSLGWIISEVYSQLRRSKPTSRWVLDSPSQKNRRFDFSTRRPVKIEEIFLSIDIFHNTANQLGIDCSEITKLLPNRNEGFSTWKSRTSMSNLHKEFEIWSKAAWSRLTAEKEIYGQVFSYGASIADTYWFNDIKPTEVSTSDRLFVESRRMAWLSAYLPVFQIDILQHSLRAWARFNKKYDDPSLLTRWWRTLRKIKVEQDLEKVNEDQHEIWRNLVLGFRSPESFLRIGDRRKITWLQWTFTILIVFLLLGLTWVSVLALTFVGESIIEFLAGVLPDGIDFIQDSTIEYLTNLGNWSSILATGSSIVLFFVGIIDKLSGWILVMHRTIGSSLRKYFILRRTTKLPKRKSR